MIKPNTKAKQAQRERDRKAGIVRYSRKIPADAALASELDEIIIKHGLAIIKC